MTKSEILEVLDSIVQSGKVVDCTQLMSPTLSDWENGVNKTLFSIVEMRPDYANGHNFGIYVIKDFNDNDNGTIFLVNLIVNDKDWYYSFDEFAEAYAN